MAYKLIVTEAAHNDLDEALGYITKRLANPPAAVHLLEQVEACYEQLRSFPLLYEACRDTRLQSLGYRKAVIDHYVLVYHPVEEEQTVYILRFFYGGRDYEKLI
jgi:toxin ParE1/3/4